MRTRIWQWRRVSLGFEVGRFLFGFIDLCRTLDVFDRQFAELSFGFGVGQVVGMPPAFVGLISQIGGPFGHQATLRQSRKRM
jgi:hypothetical protein